MFTLTPPAKSGDAWTETVLYRSQGSPNNDGVYPQAPVISDVSGNLYGTADQGGPTSCARASCGMVFELTP